MIGFIYVITNNKLWYVGSTTLPLNVRLNRHKTRARTDKTIKSETIHYHMNKSLVGKGNLDDWKIKLIEEIEFEDPNDLINKERIYINEYRAKHKKKLLNILDPYPVLNDKVHCDCCNTDISRRNIYIHKKTAKHITNANK